MSLLDVIDADRRRTSYTDYRPPELPGLSGVPLIYLNFETSGLRWWAGDKPVGFSLYAPSWDRAEYFPFAHRTGGNLDEAVVKRWFEREVRGKKIVNINTRFEVHQAREWGIDLEEQGNTVSDVAHSAALLDDHRRQFSLDVLIKDVLHKEPMARIDESKMADHHPAEVAARSRYNVEMVDRLDLVFTGELIAQDLMRVKKLEDEVIYPVCEMEKNALPMDVALLKEWHVEAEQRYLRYLWQIHRECGVKFNPGSSKNWAELFKKLGIEWDHVTATGQAVTTDNLISQINHPVVQLARKAGKLADLKSDYIDKYYNTVGDDELLRFALHQLRSDDGGTVTGRFSAGAIKIGKTKIGCNPQQVPDIAKQLEKGHDPDFIIRRLFIHGKDPHARYISADAKQIEYRLFADYARNPKIMAAYAADPDLSFHKQTHAMLLPFVPTLSYGHQKNVNFMKIYGGGLAKLAFMLGFINEQTFNNLQKEFPRGVPHDHPLLDKAREVDQIYARELPEVGPLLRRASFLAQTECNERCERYDELHRKYKHQGHVKTLTGRRSRFPHNQRLHKALNGIIQGGAADIMKQKMIEVHRQRKAIGFIPRLTNHDEICGDGLGDDTSEKLLKILNEQSFPQLRIPILWDVKVGANWAEC